MGNLKYRRVLLKLSGEVFKGDLPSGIDGDLLLGFAKNLKEVAEMGVQIGVVIGGGNFWRFRDFKEMSFDRVTSDTIGMLATIMNGLAFVDALNRAGVPAICMSNLGCDAVERYSKGRAAAYMAEGKVVVFAGGSGNPFFTTDSAAALKALELECDVLLKATKVDFVYDKDPNKFPDAVKYEEMSYGEVIEKRLEVMDLTCAALCENSGMPMIVFNLEQEGNIKRAVQGEKVGTIIN